MAIMKNAYLFVLGYSIEWEGTDIDMAVPLVQSMEAQYPHLTMTCSFDLEFYNPKFQEQLETETKLVTVVMSKKGASEYRRVQGDMSRAFTGEIVHEYAEPSWNMVDPRGEREEI